MRSTLLLVITAALAVVMPAQTCMTTTYASNTGQSGNMFDVDATPMNSVLITGFNINCDPGTYTVEIYTIDPTFTGGTTSYVGYQTNSAAWQLIDTFNGVVSAGTNIPTFLPPLTNSVSVNPDGGNPAMRTGFYITLVGSTNINYTTGTGFTEGQLHTTDGTLNFYAGRGASYPFGGSFVPRIWNGDICYIPASPPTYQVNTPPASGDFDGVMTGGYNAAVVNKVVTVCPTSVTPATVNLNLSSIDPTPAYEIFYNLVPLVPLGGGGFPTPIGIVNLDVTGGLFSLGIPATFKPLPGGSLTLPLIITGPLDISMQPVFVDSSSAAGLSLAQGSELHVTVSAVTPGGTVAGPTIDDSFVTVDVSPSTCWTTAGIPFYGTVYNQMHVISNGRVMFGPNPDVDYSPSQAEALADDPFVGFWTDLDPGPPTGGGTITISNPAPDVVRVDWVGVPYIFEPGAPNTFGIEFQAASGIVQLDGLSGIASQPGTYAGDDDGFLGMSPGILLGATNPGPVNMAPPLSSGGAALATDMLFDWYDATTGAGLPPTLLGGVNQIIFVPSPNPATIPNYNWASL